jgi:hypothetical protein
LRKYNKLSGRLIEINVVFYFFSFLYLNDYIHVLVIIYLFLSIHYLMVKRYFENILLCLLRVVCLTKLFKPYVELYVSVSVFLSFFLCF